MEATSVRTAMAIHIPTVFILEKKMKFKKIKTVKVT
jgi:hypothetical protein